MKRCDRKEILESILEMWPNLSNYLELNLTWEEFLSDCASKIKNFKGFKLRKSKYPPCWMAGFKSEKIKNETINYLYLEYSPKLHKDFIRHFDERICHELVHIIRGATHQDKFRNVDYLSSLFEEAICDVVSTKVTKYRERELKSHGLYNLIDVCALEQIIYKMGELEIRRLVFMPKGEGELRELTFLILRWISSEEYKGNIDRIWDCKIKEKVY